MGPGATQRVSSPFAEKETEAGRVAVTSKVTALVPAATRGSRESASYTWHSLCQRHLVPGSDSASRTPFLALPGAGAAGVGPTASWGNLCARKRARRSPLKLRGALQSNPGVFPGDRGVAQANQPKRGALIGSTARYVFTICYFSLLITSCVMFTTFKNSVSLK